MEFKALEGKNVEIQVGDNKYKRHAIQTHYIQLGESYVDVIKKYALPIYEEGDIVSISEKIISICQRHVIYKKDVKVSKLAKFLSKFAMRSDAGVGVDNPYKMQVAIDLNGRLKVLWAAIAGGVCKLFGKRGVFYEIVGQEISGLDGFYGDVFSDYAEFGIRIPDNPTGVCNEIYEATGVKCMIVDANDYNVEILGKADSIEYDDAELKGMIKDNPAGQTKTLTPMVLVRKA
ncbi:MAG: F420-0--gamma-glutamyl ligase [Clostridia bacterium]|nr:F420-0--gamma-glutamyl ligase [Clostridia bacterium]